MFTKAISDVADVKAFFEHLVSVENLSFHPDENFQDYVNIKTGKATFSKQQARHYDKLMTQAFDVCEKNGIDIYELGIASLVGHRAMGKAG